MKFFSGVVFGMFLVGLLVAAVLATGPYTVAAPSAPSNAEVTA